MRRAARNRGCGERPGGHSSRRRLAIESLERRFALCVDHLIDGLIDPDIDPDAAAHDAADDAAHDALDRPASDPPELVDDSILTAPDSSFAVSLAAATSPLGSAAAAIAASAPKAANGLPLLHGLPGARTAIYLDFDGEGSNAPYDEDGSPSTFNAGEATSIAEAWRQISVYFAPFDVDVTTEKPTVPFVWHVSSPSVSGGYSYVGMFPNTSPQSFNQSADARTRQSGIAHEVGHNFGLSHQSDYDLLGNKTNEYSSGYDALHGPIMGVDYAQSVHKWFIGHASGSASALQDDIAVIAGKIKQYQPTGGDGFRADDYTGTIAAATPLPVSADGTRSVSGIVERMTDVDAFSFTSTGGTSVITVTPTRPSAVDLKLEVYTASGTLVAASDGATNDQQITVPLGVGTWYVTVSSHGDYGDLGIYDLGVRELPAAWTATDVGAVGTPGFAGYDAATGTFTVAGSGADVSGTADAFGFAYQTLSGDGSITARVVQNQATNAGAKVGVEIRETLAAYARHVALVTTAANGPQLISRSTTGGSSTSVNGTAAAFAPTWVRLVRVGNVITGSRSADGVSWTTVGSVTVSMASTVSIGLLSCARTTAALNVGSFTDVALSGTLNPPAPVNDLAAPAGVAVTQGAGTTLVVSWTATPGAVGYAVERSDDGVDFTRVATTAAATTSFSDAGLPGSLRYFYRVRATNTAGVSVASAIASAVNRPSGVTGAAVTSLTTSSVVLNWRDTSGESGYRIERSSDNVTFTQIATVGMNVPSYAVTGLPMGTISWFRITPQSPFGDSVGTVISGSSRLQPVTGLAFAAKSATGMSIQWSPVTFATGYRIERSTDGTTFAPLASVAGGVLTYTDTAVQPLGKYFYRVIGTTAVTEGTNPTAIFAAAPAATPPPAPWSSADIGSVSGTGATGLSAGTFTVVSTGSDIWSTADAFRYVYQPLVGDGSIVARVASLENTGGWAKIGVMIRESLAANSRHAMLAVTPSNGVAMQYRSSTGGASTSVSGPIVAAPYWLRLVRTGNVLTGSTSANGVTWTQVSSVTIPMASSVLIGLSANSNLITTLNRSTFDNVTVSNVAPTVAAAATASPATVTGTTTALSVLGADDHGESALAYTWAASGPAAVSFSANGTNTAKSTVATFSKAGFYTFTATIADASGLTVTSQVGVTVSQTLSAIAVTPASATLLVAATRQFAASAVDQFGATLAAQPSFTWSATGGGQITSSGVFTAPASAATTTVSASASGVVGAATVVTQIEQVVTVAAGQTAGDAGGEPVRRSCGSAGRARS